MTENEKTPESETCEHCGEVFSDFLKQMAEHNEQIVCPKCGRAHQTSN